MSEYIIDDSSYGLNFDLGKKNKKTTARKSMLTLVKVWPRNVVKCGKYSPAKFANFVLISITHGKMHHIWAESVTSYPGSGYEVAKSGAFSCVY
jgi:hypothetical protein